MSLSFVRLDKKKRHMCREPDHVGSRTWAKWQVRLCGFELHEGRDLLTVCDACRDRLKKLDLRRAA